MNIVKEVNKLIDSQAQVVIKMNELILGINGLLKYLKENPKEDKLEALTEQILQYSKNFDDGVFASLARIEAKFNQPTPTIPKKTVPQKKRR